MNSAPFHFHYNKASQAIATLLRSERDKRMNYYRLLKLLYIADRQSVGETGHPIIGGRLVAMKRGPLHSAVLDLIQGKALESPSGRSASKKTSGTSRWSTTLEMPTCRPAKLIC